MTRIRNVGGKIIETTGGKEITYAKESIVFNAKGKISFTAKDGIFLGDNPKDAPESKNLDFEIDFEIDKDEKTVVPFGILDFKNKAENPFFIFKYALKKSSIDSLNFKITDDKNEIIYQMGYLKPVIIQAKKKPLVLFEAKKPKEGPLISKTWDYLKMFEPYVLSEPDYTKVGEYHLNWDGFDNNEIYDSTRFAGKKLKAQITAIKGNKVKTKEIEFEVSYKQVDWVDVKIDRNVKRIDVTLRVNLTDGGAKGLSCNTYTIDEEMSYETFTPTNGVDPLKGKQITTCDWDKIPASKINPSHPVIKRRTRSFSDLEKLALEGLNYHWGRNRNHDIAKFVNIYNEQYEVYIFSENTKKNTMDDVALNYNTNSDWMRSGNPGSATWNPISWIGNIVSREAICYNVGYIKYSNGWGYSEEMDEDLEFKDTSAHEIGHEILKSYGTTEYSYGHKGSSEIYSLDQHMKDDAPEFPLKGEIDLMPYFNNNILGGKWKQPNYFQRRIASEKDVLSLVWLTKLKII